LFFNKREDAPVLNTIEIRLPFDAHLHLRDGGILRDVLPATLAWCSGAIVMPNLKPPVRTVEDARAYRKRILDCVPQGSTFEPLMTCYLTEQTDPEDLRKGFCDSGDSSHSIIHAVKYYPAGATTNSAEGVSNIRKMKHVLAVMEEIGMPLCLHGEQLRYNAKGDRIDIFHREEVFIRETLYWLGEQFPHLPLVFEHVSTAAGVRYVEEGAAAGRRIMATITPHHLIWTRTDIFDGGIRPDRYCMPIVKSERDLRAIRKAAVSGTPCFSLGTDSAPHDESKKYCACGAAGVFNATTSLQAYARVFEEEGIFEQSDGVGRFENFCSVYGPRFYRIPPSEKRITLARQPWKVPMTHRGVEVALAPFLAGEELQWQIA
jgi:dihydroorotase